MKTATRLLGGVAAFAVMLGLAATPTQAAPPQASSAVPASTAVVVAQPAKAMPGVAGPTYHWTDKASAQPNGDASVMGASLPFNYTFEYEVSMNGRDFNTTTGTVCNWTDVYSTQNIDIGLFINVAFGQDPQVGNFVSFPAAGGTHYYCWTGLNNNNEYYLAFHDGWAQGAGSVTASS